MSLLLNSGNKLSTKWRQVRDIITLLTVGPTYTHSKNFRDAFAPTHIFPKPKSNLLRNANWTHVVRREISNNPSALYSKRVWWWSVSSFCRVGFGKRVAATAPSCLLTPKHIARTYLCYYAMLLWRCVCLGEYIERTRFVTIYNYALFHRWPYTPFKDTHILTHKSWSVLLVIACFQRDCVNWRTWSSAFERNAHKVWNHNQKPMRWQWFIINNYG